MKAKQILLFALAVFCFSFVANAQRGVRIGYIDMEYILENVPEYRESETQLEGKVQRWKADIEKKQLAIDQMKLNLANERVLLTKELIEEREEEIQILEEEMLKYQQDRFGPNGDLMIQRRQLVQPIQDQVFNIVQEIAVNKKYDFIFDKSADIVMLFAAERNDISDQVVRTINRAAKREEALSKREKKEIEKREELSVEEEGAISEREQAIEDKKNERARIMEERRRVRDSVRDASRREFEARRQRLLEERQARRDSILRARSGGGDPPPDGGDGDGDEGNGDGGL
ncbi:MAG: OmpH family outer membrane protein [Bacteroidia bacterium]|nr:OmpH family outer membrane protein [Bacteroidia bacterium]NNF32307.1 OmpH family outer membrane protein [Flavobacteriaceae bacterium]MBT8276107.1 OmpH family outer membrane protein [Bacteroidia bacterium]NNJ83011.1 OmpH family outer membrane protein [Flavobacteriaceae bacterium]NNK53933.1 OmpH family outer membrane protein [Flavobacteriaceae bacterium]